MRGRHHVGSGRVDLRMNGKGGRVEQAVALDHITAIVDENQIGHTQQAEGKTERIDPEVVQELGVAVP